MHFLSFRLFFLVRFFQILWKSGCHILVTFPSHLKKLRSKLRFWLENLNCRFFYSWKNTTKQLFSSKLQCRNELFLHSSGYFWVKPFREKIQKSFSLAFWDKHCEFSLFAPFSDNGPLCTTVHVRTSATFILMISSVQKDVTIWRTRNFSIKTLLY